MQVNDIFFFDGHTNSLADLRTVQVRIDPIVNLSMSSASGASSYHDGKVSEADRCHVSIR